MLKEVSDNRLLYKKAYLYHQNIILIDKMKTVTNYWIS